MESLAGQKVESGGKSAEWDGVQGGEGTLTIATIFLTAFRPHGRGRGRENRLLIACTKAIHKGVQGFRSTRRITATSDRSV